MLRRASAKSVIPCPLDMARLYRRWRTIASKVSGARALALLARHGYSSRRSSCGLVAEWLCSGLQIRVCRFDSGPGLHRLRDIGGPCMVGNALSKHRAFAPGLPRRRETLDPG